MSNPTFANMKGDGPRTASTLTAIRLGQIKKSEAAKALQQARYDDFNAAKAAGKGGES